jgi:hypothetical protein
VRADAERRLLQGAVVLASLVPLSMGLMSVIEGASVIRGVGAPTTDLDSHFRYLSGLLLGIGLAYLAALPRIERSTTLFRLLGGIILVGGLARLLSLAEDGAPSEGHVFGLAMELGVVPAITLWQSRIARRFSGPGKK